MMNVLRNFGLSNAHTQHNFIYTNTREGWFFSPHTEETWFRVLVRQFSFFPCVTHLRRVEPSVVSPHM